MIPYHVKLTLSQLNKAIKHLDSKLKDAQSTVAPLDLLPSILSLYEGVNTIKKDCESACEKWKEEQANRNQQKLPHIESLPFKEMGSVPV